MFSEGKKRKRRGEFWLEWEGGRAGRAGLTPFESDPKSKKMKVPTPVCNSKSETTDYLIGRFYR